MLLASDADGVENLHRNGLVTVTLALNVTGNVKGMVW